MDYLFHLVVLVGVYSILTWSLDLVAGHLGLLSVAQAAFYGLGAYSSALISVRLGGSFLVGVAVGMVVSGLAACTVSLFVAGLRGDFFAIATFGAQMMVFSALNNWADLTGGPLGIPNIPPATLFGWTATTPGRFAVLTASLAALALIITTRLSGASFGRVMHAIREDELLTRAFGKNTLRFKATVFAVSGALAALAGSLYAHYVTYIDPTSFALTESVLVISMLIVGGSCSPLGPVTGAGLVVVLPEVLRFLGLPNNVAANTRQILYGVLLVLALAFRPRGIIGRHAFGR
jgi:branched-chain amino acid transport system permease protein